MILSIAVTELPDTDCVVRSDLPPEPKTNDDQSSRVQLAALWVVVSLLPFWIIPMSHVASEPQTATGFFHYELPYYVANGRAAFERGNGLSYPNPYQPDQLAPAIYAHWLPWIFGALTSIAELNPGDVILAATVLASILFALATRSLVACRIEASLVRTQTVQTRSDMVTNAAFLIAMWGGGLLALAGTAASFFGAGPWLETVLKFDPGNGLWFLNWGRNALFPTEAVYHSIVAGCWIAELRNRKRTANMFLLLLATTHPWSGLELLLTVNLWRFAVFAKSCETSAAKHLAFSGITLAIFLGYYKVWLPSFPSHAELQDVWKLAWSVPWTSAGLAYLPVVIPACIQVRKQIQDQTLGQIERFLLCALIIAAGLAFHDRLIPPVQPIHFTRGYIWMPLFLLGLPTLIRWSQQVTSVKRKVMIASALVVLVPLDNIVFSMVHAQRQLAHIDGFHVNVHERSLMKSLHESPETRNQIVLTESESLNYLLPTYAAVRPWLGHHFNTPNYPDRRQQWAQVFTDGGVYLPAVPDDVRVLVLRTGREASAIEDASDWVTTDIRNAEWEVWLRRD